MAYAYLNKIKTMLGVTGSFQDEALRGYADEAIEFLVDAGVERSVAESEKCVGVIARGVSDLWNLGSGNASLSSYFKQRAIQLAYKAKKEERNV